MSIPTSYEEWRTKAQSLSRHQAAMEQLTVMRELVQSFPQLGFPRSSTIADFVQPAINGTVTITLDHADWLAPFLVLSIGLTVDGTWAGGVYQVVSVARDTNQVTIKRLDGGTFIPSSTDGVTISTGSLCALCAFIPKGESTAAAVPQNVSATILNGAVKVTWDMVDPIYADEIVIAWGHGDGPGHTTGEGTYIVVPSSEVSCRIRTDSYGFYWIKVSARLNGKLGQASQESPLWLNNKAPAIPTNITASVDGSCLLLHWDTLASSALSVVVDYWEASEKQHYRLIGESGSESVSLYLPYAGSWNYRLATQDEAANIGDWTAAKVIAYLGTQNPDSPSFTLSGDTLKVTWTNAPSSDLVMLEWRKSDVEGGTATLSSGLDYAFSREGQNSLVKQLTPGWYFFRLWNYFNGAWSGAGEPESGTWVQVKEASMPTNVTAAVSLSAVHVSWKALSDASVIYLEYWAAVADGQTPQKTSLMLDGDSVGQDILMTTMGSYAYRVGAKKNGGAIQWATPGTFTIASPTTPTNFAGTLASAVATLTWGSLITDKTVFWLEVQVNLKGADATSTTFTPIAYLPKHYTSMTYDQPAGNTYIFRVRSLDAYGNASDWVSVTVTS